MIVLQGFLSVCFWLKQSHLICLYDKKCQVLSSVIGMDWFLCATSIVDIVDYSDQEALFSVIFLTFTDECRR